jgi:hypothetical protein
MFLFASITLIYSFFSFELKALKQIYCIPTMRSPDEKRTR